MKSHGNVTECYSTYRMVTLYIETYQNAPSRGLTDTSHHAQPAPVCIVHTCAPVPFSVSSWLADTVARIDHAHFDHVHRHQPARQYHRPAGHAHHRHRVPTHLENLENSWNFWYNKSIYAYKSKVQCICFTTYFLQQVLTLIAFNYVW